MNSCRAAASSLLGTTTADLAIFGMVSGALRTTVEAPEIRRPAGDIILRAGVPSAELFGLIDGAVRVELSGGGRRLLLLPPQCFGELSALTGDPVSANVVAQRDA